MQFIDCRRLTGPNLLWERPSVVLDVACTVEEAVTLPARWQEAVLAMHKLLDRPQPAFCHRGLEGGISLAFDAPIDALYSGIAIAEWAWAECSGEHPDMDETASLILARCAEEANPALVEMQRAASHYGAPFLWDDDKVSVGHGASTISWVPAEIPTPDRVDWKAIKRIPIGIVTGTNGKTTTSRMAAHILKGAGQIVGLTSTEGVSVGGVTIELGDYSGPGGARLALRHVDTDVAVLETARGGLLRRGLGVEEADVALITNLAADHLGDFGSRTMQELLDIKWVVTRAVEEKGLLILNADDPLLVERAKSYQGRTEWFSMRAHPCARFVHDGGTLIEISAKGREPICRADEIPLTLGGVAAHNIANALAAAALARSLGASVDQVSHGLKSMPVAANPGRGNRYQFNGMEILVDFAHNPHAMQAIADMVQVIPARRRLLAFGQAGDRTDDLVRELARSAWSMSPDQIIFCELEHYARGRAPGELYKIVQQELKSLGLADGQLVHVQSESAALDEALTWARPGDLLVMLILADSAGVRQRIEKMIHSEVS